MTSSTSESTVSALPVKVARTTPEMLVRWLMANMDRIDQLAMVVDIKDATPQVLISTSCNSYVLSLASTILSKEALNRLPKPPQEGKK